MMSSAADLGELRQLAAGLAEEQQADILLYRGHITRAAGDQVSAGRRGRPGRPNLVLILSTLGGSADTAYRLARTFRRSYERFTVYIDEYCKTAGTLLALGADELVISEFGELGPLDAQLNAPVELGRMSSGLTSVQALRALQAEVLHFFQYHFVQLRGGAGLPTRLAAEQASEMASGLFSPIYAQIDPMQLGEIERGTTTSRQYGERIGTANLKDGALEKLVTYYPSHDFVIDRDEARELFRRVREPTTDEAELLKYLEPILALPGNQSRFIYLDELLATAWETDEEAGGDVGGAEPAGAAGEGRPEADADESRGSS
jgi:hypothetical protein